MRVLSPNATIYARDGGTNLERLAADPWLCRRRHRSAEMDPAAGSVRPCRGFLPALVHPALRISITLPASFSSTVMGVPSFIPESLLSPC
jgi:hypothetical protein